MEVKISKLAHDKINYWVQKASGEVSGMGLIELLPDNSFYVSDVFMAKQTNSGASTDIDPNSLGELVFDLLQKGLITETKQLKFWWHSHANMSVFWSSTDTTTIKQLSETWLVASVFNKKYESLTSFSCMADTVIGKRQIFEDKLQLVVEGTQKSIAEWDAEYEKYTKPEPKLAWAHNDDAYAYANDPWEDIGYRNSWNKGGSYDKRKKQDTALKAIATKSNIQDLAILYGYDVETVEAIKTYCDTNKATHETFLEILEMGYDLEEINNAIDLGYSLEDVAQGYYKYFT